MQIIRGEKSYSKILIRKNLIEKYQLIGFILLFVIIYVLYFINNTKRINPESFVVLFSMTIGMLACLFYIWVFKKLDKLFLKKDININKARLGDRGEELVCNRLKEILGDFYYMYPNFKIPGRKFDVDFLIIGPKGLIAMEVKNSSNHFSFSEKEALKIKGTGYTQEITRLIGNADPRVKLNNHCKSLNYYFYSLGLRGIKSKKVLVFTNGSISIDGKAGIYIVKKLELLNKYFENLKDDDRFSPEYCAVIVEKLNDSLKKS